MTYLKLLFFTIFLSLLASCSNNSYDQNKVYEFYSHVANGTCDNVVFNEILDQLDANMKLQMKTFNKIPKNEGLTARRTELQEFFRSYDGQVLLESQRWMEWVMERNIKDLEPETAARYQQIKDTTGADYVACINSFYD